MRVNLDLDSSSIKKTRTKRLLQFGCPGPQEVYQVVEDLFCNKMLFEPLNPQAFEDRIESLKFRLNKLVSQRIIVDYHVSWYMPSDVGSIKLKVLIQEYSTTTDMCHIDVTLK